MARLVFGMNQSLDGYVDHMAFAPSPTLFRHFIEEAQGQAGSVYGRQMYEVMRDWDDDHPEWDAEEHAFAAAWRKQPKRKVLRVERRVGRGAVSRPPKGRRLEGIQIRPNCLMAYVKVGDRQVAKSFPPTTDPDVIQVWRAETRKELRKGLPEKGTLAADIERFLALPYLSVGKRRRKPLEGRTKLDFQTWLAKWAQSDLGKAPRSAITQKMIEDQLQEWQEKGYGPSSLNHLRQSLITVWRELDGVDHDCPAAKVAKFDESGCVRKGFFETDTLVKALNALPQGYRDVVEFAAFSGWRRQEIQGLLWSEVDEAGGVIRLSPERSKNEHGRVLPITGPIADVIGRRPKRDGLPYVFTYTYGGKKTALRYRRIGDWRKRWANATKAAGCEGALLHDLRRTVVRNLTRAGVPEKIAMGWTGHKTRSVFDRYDIVNEADLRAAGERLAAHVQAAKKTEPGNGG